MLMSCRGHDGVTFDTKCALGAPLLGITSGLLQAYFRPTLGLLGFLGFVWGNKLMKNAVLGEISSGVGFLVRGRGIWKAKV